VSPGDGMHLRSRKFGYPGFSQSSFPIIKSRGNCKCRHCVRNLPSIRCMIRSTNVIASAIAPSIAGERRLSILGSFAETMMLAAINIVRFRPSSIAAAYHIIFALSSPTFHGHGIFRSDQCIQFCMRYATGEDMRIGDFVTDDGHRIGRIARIISPPPKLAIKWDDGTLGICFSPDDVGFVERGPTPAITVTIANMVSASKH
jgi:hypothetical protein